MGRRAMDPELRKKEFVKAALELFQEKGFEQTSVTDITNKVGVSHGAFFYYYKSKNDIMADVITAILDENISFVKGLVDNKNMTAIEKLRVIMNTSVNSHKGGSCNGLTEYFHRPSNVAFHKDYARRERSLLNPLFLQIAEQGIREGTCEIKYPRETIEYLSYVFEGLDDSFYEGQSNEEYYRKIRALEVLVTKALGIRDAGISLID